MNEPTNKRRISPSYLAAMMVVGAAIVCLTIFNFAPALATTDADSREKQTAILPNFDFSPWHGLAVQDGRLKPFESACIESVRKICGRSRFDGLDPVAIVLSWMLLEGRGDAKSSTDWENHPFILCRHRGLRSQIFEHLESAASLRTAGKHLSPSELRSSPGFDRLLVEVADRRQADPSKAQFQMTAEQRKAEEVIRRLVLFDALCGRTTTKLFRSKMVGQRLVKNGGADDAAKSGQGPALNPIHIVQLDPTPDSAWFSMTELREMKNAPNVWSSHMESRIAERPQAYLNRECRKALQQFQQRIRTRDDDAALVEIATLQKNRRAEKLRQFRELHHRMDFQNANQMFNEILRSAPTELADRARKSFQSPNVDPTQALADAVKHISAMLEYADENRLARLEQGLMLARKGYDAASPNFRMLHLEYIETRFPDFYRVSLNSHVIPAAHIDRALKSFDNLRKEFSSNDAEMFRESSARFFESIRRPTDANSNARTSVDNSIRIELAYNRGQPFLWSWIVMLAAAVILLASLISGNSASYIIGLILYIASLVVQTLGFVSRIYISGRAPVGNIYETVIWAAAMSAVFALVLELIYRRRVIALAGAVVATFGLILADQLPLALDPQISQLAPVLRTNYWLTIHVITIVSSYAAGTLAWGLGNITLGILAFGRGDRETLKMLSHFTYRAIQITVLLLATGTFLGGWWAAESWGRFWGWDPKEVGALIALVCYVIPLHARYIGWVKHFGLAIAAVACYASIIVSWYVVNFIFASGLHSYGFGGAGGMLWVLWAVLLNVEWLLVCGAIRASSESNDELN